MTKTIKKLFPFLLSFFSLIFLGCSQTNSSKNIKNTSTSASSTTGGGSTTDPGTTTVSGCDGIFRQGITKCYFTNIPRFVFSGLPSKQTFGPTIWSSAGGLPSNIDPNQFRTDATFSVRIKALFPNGGELSKQGRTCGTHLVSNFSKLKAFVMLRRNVDSIGEVKELTANVNAYSNTARFSVPGGTEAPYILEVVGLASDHRCKTEIYGALTPQETAACSNGLLLDIPLRTGTNPTECVSFNLEMATDNTYDLPN